MQPGDCIRPPPSTTQLPTQAWRGSQLLQALLAEPCSLCPRNSGAGGRRRLGLTSQAMHTAELRWGVVGGTKAPRVLSSLFSLGSSLVTQEVRKPPHSG